MKNFLFILALLVAAAFTGCTLVETAHERRAKIAHQGSLQLRMLVDDWDYLLLRERNSNLTYYHPRVGPKATP